MILDRAMVRRQWMFDTLRHVFEAGFVPIQTPSFENSTLTGKYGEEGDQLIFKISTTEITSPRRTMPCWRAKTARP